MPKKAFILIVCVIVVFTAYFVWISPQKNSDIEPQEVLSDDVEAVVEEVKMDIYQTITPDDALSMLEDGAFLLDVRTKEEYASGHIAESILIPVDEIKNQISAMIPDKTASVIIYCRSGNRSKRAAYDLIELGYENVFDLGGIISWPYETVK